jgi:hypothetical protein
MQFTLTILSALAAVAIAGPLASANEGTSALTLIERGSEVCPCHADKDGCGCPSDTICLCQHGVPPVRAPCYPNCGCPSTSAVCIVGLLSILCDRGKHD